MRRGLPNDGSSARAARIRRAAPASRGKSSSSSSPAAWWHQPLLWLLLLASLPLVNAAVPGPADWWSWPYLWARLFGTAVCAFFALWMSYRLALRVAKSPAALLATIAIWLASSLPVYLYVLPFSSYAVAMFSFALVLTILLSVRPVTALIFLAGAALIGAAWVAVMRPSLPVFRWASPRLFATAFSTEQGAFLWTPVLLLAVLGLAVAIRRQPALGSTLFVVGAFFFYLVAAFDGGRGDASYGSRFLVALTPMFVCGLAALIDASLSGRGRGAWAVAVAIAALFVLWNLGLMLQWGTGLIPNRGAVDFRQAAVNQVTVVPRAAKDFVIRYINDRKGLVNDLEGGAR